MKFPIKITAEIGREIIRLAALGDNHAEIARKICEAYKITLTRMAVSKFLHRTRDARGDAAKAIVREALAGHIVSDLDILTMERDRCLRLSVRLHRKTHTLLNVLERAKRGDESVSSDELKMAVNSAHNFADMALKASDRVRAIVDRKLHFAGADSGDVNVNVSTPAEARRVMAELFGGHVATPGLPGSTSPEGDAPIH